MFNIYQDETTGRIIATELLYTTYKKICEIDVLPCEEQFLKLNVAGNGIEIDTVSLEQAKKPALLAQLRTQLIKELDNSEKNVSNHPPYPNDTPIWIVSRERWRAQLQEINLKTYTELLSYTIEPRPFGN